MTWDSLFAEPDFFERHENYLVVTASSSYPDHHLESTWYRHVKHKICNLLQLLECERSVQSIVVWPQEYKTQIGGCRQLHWLIGVTLSFERTVGWDRNIGNQFNALVEKSFTAFDTWINLIIRFVSSIELLGILPRPLWPRLDLDEESVLMELRLQKNSKQTEYIFPFLRLVKKFFFCLHSEKMSYHNSETSEKHPLGSTNYSFWLGSLSTI